MQSMMHIDSQTGAAMIMMQVIRYLFWSTFLFLWTPGAFAWSLEALRIIFVR